MEQSGKISQRQFIGLMVVNILSTGLVYVPAGLLFTSGRDAYLSLGISFFTGLAVAWVIGRAREYHPEKTFVAWLIDLLGSKLGKTLAFAYAVFWLLTVITIVLPGSMMIHVAFMPETPLSVLVFSLAGLTGYAAYLGIEPMARFNTFILLAMIITFLALGLINVRNMDFNRLLPILENGWAPLWAGVLNPVGWFGQVALSFSFSPQINNPKHRISLFWIVIISALGLEYVLMLLLVTMGPILATFYEFPTLQLARIAAVGGNIRGFDALIMTIWVTAVSLKGAIWLYAALLTFGELFRLKEQRHLIPLFIILISLFAYLGVDNISEMKYYGRGVWSQFSLVTFEGGIPLLLLFFTWRKQSSKK